MKTLAGEMFTGALFVVMSTAAEKQSPDSQTVTAGVMAIMRDGVLVDTAVAALNSALADETKE